MSYRAKDQAMVDLVAELVLSKEKPESPDDLVPLIVWCQMALNGFPREDCDEALDQANRVLDIIEEEMCQLKEGTLLN